MPYLIRNSEKADAYDITHVITLVWNETYRGLVPDNSYGQLEKVKK